MSNDGLRYSEGTACTKSETTISDLPKFISEVDPRNAIQTENATEQPEEGRFATLNSDDLRSCVNAGATYVSNGDVLP